jgi:hypothetical protein
MDVARTVLGPEAPAKPEQTRFLVVSYDSDEHQWFYDTVLAPSAEDASAFIQAVRPYVIAADASQSSDFQGTNARLILKGHEWDANEPLSECQDCGGVFPQSKLKPVKDLHARVAPGEPMPSGECPECGAVCQPIDEGE